MKRRWHSRMGQVLRVTETSARRGASLITVLAFSVVTLTIGASIMTSGASETRNAQQRVNSTQAFWLAEAGFQKFMAEEYTSVAWLAAHRSFTDTLSGGSYTLSIRDTTVSGLASGTTPYHVISTGTANGYNATSSRMLDMLLTITPGNAGINLGTASSGTYTTLATGSTAVTITGSSVVSGSAANIGVKSGGSMTIAGSASVAGTIYADTGITVSSGGSSTFGAIVQNSTTNAALNQAALDATAASASYALLPATISTTSLSGSTTITGTTGQNVMNLTSISVNGSKTITINAPAGSSFVINVSGAFDVNGSSSFKLSGGIRAADVLWNVTGAGTMKLNGSSEFNGILLVPNRAVTLNGSSSFTGAVICGGSSLDIKGSSAITGAGAPTSSPADAAPALATLHWAEHGAH